VQYVKIDVVTILSVSPGSKTCFILIKANCEYQRCAGERTNTRRARKY